MGLPGSSSSDRGVEGFPVGSGGAGGVHSSEPSRPQFDSDFEADRDPPDWRVFIDKEEMDKLKPKEKKRQDVINGELICKLVHKLEYKGQEKMVFYGRGVCYILDIHLPLLQKSFRKAIKAFIVDMQIFLSKVYSY